VPAKVEISFVTKHILAAKSRSLSGSEKFFCKMCSKPDGYFCSFHTCTRWC
jgi:hypothetical protein